MLSPNPDPSLFNIILPNDFFIKSITEKFSMHLKQFNYPFSSIEQVFNESIQSFDMPDFGFTMISQNTIDINHAGYEAFQIPKTSEQSLIDDKLIALTMRHTNGFMTYFLALELFFERYKLGFNQTKRKPFGTVILQTLDIARNVVCNIKLHNCQIVGLSGLPLTFAKPNRDFSTYTLTIGYTEFETSLNVPDLVFNKK
jgi:hypothetical protein